MSKIRPITADELEACYRSSEPVVLVDAREQRAYDRVHLPGARHVPPGKTSTMEVAERKIIVYGTGPADSRAAQVARALAQQSGQAAWVLRSGITGWRSEGGPLAGSGPRD